MLKKVVVVYPYHHEVPYSGATVAYVGSSKMVHVGEKTFEGKSLEVVNTDAGNLIIKEANGPTYAVFKEWIYWENIE